MTVGRNRHAPVTTYVVGVARPSRQPPRDTSPAWPDSPCVDPTAEVARLLTINLRRSLNGRSLRTARELTGVDHTTVAAVLNGTTWPDLATIARLEAGLNANLWPGRIPK